MGYTWLIADKVLVKWEGAGQTHVIDNFDVKAIMCPTSPKVTKPATNPTLTHAMLARAVELAMKEDSCEKSHKMPETVCATTRGASWGEVVWTGPPITPAVITPCPARENAQAGSGEAPAQGDGRVAVRVRGADQSTAEALRWLLGDIENATNHFSALYGGQKFVLLWEGEAPPMDEPPQCPHGAWDVAVKIAKQAQNRHELLIASLEAACITWRLWFPPNVIQPKCKEGENLPDFSSSLELTDSFPPKEPPILKLDAGTNQDIESTVPDLSWSAFKEIVQRVVVALFEGPDLGECRRHGESAKEALVRYVQSRLKMEIWDSVPLNIVAHIADLPDAFKEITSSFLKLSLNYWANRQVPQTFVTTALTLDPETWKVNEATPVRIVPPADCKRSYLFISALSNGQIGDTRGQVHVWPREIALGDPSTMAWISFEGDLLRPWVAGLLLARIPVRVEVIRLESVIIPFCRSLRLLLGDTTPEWPLTSPLQPNRICVLPSLKAPYSIDAAPKVYQDQQATPMTED